jgi:predicted nucleotidyltransferase
VRAGRAILGANLCGAYLHGSFAVGGADVHSDVDFTVVTNREVGGEQLAGLQVIHDRIHRLASSWARHLEGSYIPRQRLRRVDPSRASYLYLDNGAKRLIWDNHCNTAVVRWSLRECGIVLAGPHPKTLIDAVSAEDLRREAFARVREYVQWAPESTQAGPMSRWKQPYFVLTFCRLLHTLVEGRVASKPEAGMWGPTHARPAVDNPHPACFGRSAGSVGARLPASRPRRHRSHAGLCGLVSVQSSRPATAALARVFSMNQFGFDTLRTRRSDGAAGIATSRTGRCRLRIIGVPFSVDGFRVWPSPPEPFVSRERSKVGRCLRREPGSPALGTWQLTRLGHKLRSAGARGLGERNWRPNSLSVSNSARRLFGGQIGRHSTRLISPRSAAGKPSQCCSKVR